MGILMKLNECYDMGIWKDTKLDTALLWNGITTKDKNIGYDISEIQLVLWCGNMKK